MLESELFTETSAKGEGVCKKRTFADVGEGGVWENADDRKILGIFHKIQYKS